MSPSDIDSSQWGEEVALLVLTYSALERYLPAVRANLDLFWPERPKTFYATDGAISDSDVLNFKHVTFVELLSGAIASLVETNPKITHVILMLEDLCPLAWVDNNKLKKAYNVLRAHNKKYLTAQWPVHEGYVWKRDNWRETCGSIIDHGTVLTQIPSGWDAYNSLVVCLWEVSYLEEVIFKKIFYKKLDPWSFESPLDN